jgi:hypothetical protein
MEWEAAMRERSELGRGCFYRPGRADGGVGAVVLANGRARRASSMTLGGRRQLGESPSIGRGEDCAGGGRTCTRSLSDSCRVSVRGRGVWCCWV